jgi:hypothetical protein
MSDFLDGLKKAIETGEFNSEAAKKINEIDKVANTITPEEAARSLNKKVEDSGIKAVSAEEAKKANTEYELKMQALKEQELVIQQVATLKDIDEAVMLTIGDMFDFVKTLETSFDKTKPLHLTIFAEIERIKSKYSSIINN